MSHNQQLNRMASLSTLGAYQMQIVQANDTTGMGNTQSWLVELALGPRSDNRKVS